jgi:hypothetical protein
MTGKAEVSSIGRRRSIKGLLHAELGIDISLRTIIHLSVRVVTVHTLVFFTRTLSRIAGAIFSTWPENVWIASVSRKLIFCLSYKVTTWRSISTNFMAGIAESISSIGGGITPFVADEIR